MGSTLRVRHVATVIITFAISAILLISLWGSYLALVNIEDDPGKPTYSFAYEQDETDYAYEISVETEPETTLEMKNVGINLVSFQKDDNSSVVKYYQYSLEDYSDTIRLNIQIVYNYQTYDPDQPIYNVSVYVTFFDRDDDGHLSVNDHFSIDAKYLPSNRSCNMSFQDMIFFNIESGIGIGRVALYTVKGVSSCSRDPEIDPVCLNLMILLTVVIISADVFIIRRVLRNEKELASLET